MVANHGDYPPHGQQSHQECPQFPCHRHFPRHMDNREDTFLVHEVVVYLRRFVHQSGSILEVFLSNPITNGPSHRCVLPAPPLALGDTINFPHSTISRWWMQPPLFDTPRMPRSTTVSWIAHPQSCQYHIRSIAFSSLQKKLSARTPSKDDANAHQRPNMCLHLEAPLCNIPIDPFPCP